MRAADPVLHEPWLAELSLGFGAGSGGTRLVERRSVGPLVVQKPFYPEGPDVCHVVVVHPPGGIAGGDELTLRARVEAGAAALLTTPGAAKWYRTRGPLARQRLEFQVDGLLEWLPRETIVFDGAVAELRQCVTLGAHGRYVSWEVMCLGRRGSGERYERGEVSLEASLSREGRTLWLERGRIPGGGAILSSPAGLQGCSVLGTFVATVDLPPGELLGQCRALAALTRLPGLLVARYLGDSGEEAMERFASLWKLLRPLLAGRPAVAPRIWST